MRPRGFGVLLSIGAWATMAMLGCRADPTAPAGQTVYFQGGQRTRTIVSASGSRAVGGTTGAPADPQVPGTVRWAYVTGGAVASTPAVGPDGTIYVGSDDGRLHALRPDGSKYWELATGGPVRASPVIDAGGTIYVGSWDRHLYAVQPDGTIKWQFSLSSQPSGAALDGDGTIYVGSGDGTVYALGADGTQRWQYRLGNFTSSPVVGLDGTIYLGCGDARIYAIRKDGALQWFFRTGESVHTAPAIGFDGVIYVGSDDHNVYAINPDGTQRWSFTTLGRVRASPAVGVDGTVYAGSTDGRFYAITPDGGLRWVFRSRAGETAPPAIYTTPALSNRGLIYLADEAGDLHGIDPNGVGRWRLRVSRQPILSSPVIDASGDIHLGANDGRLYTISGRGTWADGAWPMYQHDPRHTGRVGGLQPPGAGPVISNLFAIGELVPQAQGPLAISCIVTEPGGTVTSVVANLAEVGGPYAQALERTVGQQYAWSGVVAPPTAGTRTVTVMATDDNGNVGTARTTIPVAPPATGQVGAVRWRFAMQGDVISSPAIGADGTIYIGSWDHSIYALNPDGTLLWKLPIGGAISSSAAIGPGGIVWVGARDRALYAVYGRTGPAETPWPMFRHDARHTGRAVASTTRPAGSPG